jgi:hypothetical protein
MMPYNEIVHVLDDRWLINAESYQCRYETAQRAPLAAGFYVATWLETIRNPRYDGDAIFNGPFVSRAEALASLRRCTNGREFTVGGHAAAELRAA